MNWVHMGCFTLNSSCASYEPSPPSPCPDGYTDLQNGTSCLLCDVANCSIPVPGDDWIAEFWRTHIHRSCNTSAKFLQVNLRKCQSPGTIFSFKKVHTSE